ncbi:hypothetical protein S40288_11232 [Stachybotrys chartarum IBT 40288]|nr:hypothetical protein S40288_11232 [Stachybotrys chartarum IBT 40288]
MDPVYHFDNFNRTHFSKRATGFDTFDLFPRLPPEIQQPIWKFAVRRKRLLHITLTERISRDGTSRKSERHYTAINKLGRVISGRAYLVWLPELFRINPLFTTCVGSRRAALRHYRACLPFNSQVARPPYLRFNPKYDFFVIENSSEPGVLVDFLHDAKAYDPKNIGPRQLAMEQDVCMGLDRIHLAEFPPIALESLRTILADLRHFWAVCWLYTGARIMLGVLSGTRNPEMRLNRSVPICSFAGEFEWLDVDPRPFEPDLNWTTAMRHPDRTTEAWKRFEERVFDGMPQAETKRVFSHVLAERGRAPPLVADGPSLDRYLLGEQRQWAHWVAKLPGLGKGKFRESDQRKKELLSVAGLWVFPEDTFHGLTSNAMSVPGKLVADLRGHRPGLAAACLH